MHRVYDIITNTKSEGAEVIQYNKTIDIHDSIPEQV